MSYQSYMTVGFPDPCHVNYDQNMYVSTVQQVSTSQLYCTIWEFTQINIHMHDRLHHIKNVTLLSLTFCRLHNYSLLVNLQSRPELHVGDINNQLL